MLFVQLTPQESKAMERAIAAQEPHEPTEALQYARGQQSGPKSQPEPVVYATCIAPTPLNP